MRHIRNILIILTLAIGNFFIQGKTMKCTQNTRITTKSGCTFTAEQGWKVIDKDDVLVLEEPAKELTVTLTENQEKTACHAIEAAWKKVNSRFSCAIEHTLQEIPKDGWQEIVQYTYAVTDNRFIAAIARKKDVTWYIELIDGTKSAIERRMAGVLLINQSFKVPGIEKESFSQKQAQHFDEKRIQEFIAFVEEARKQCGIPGVALALVQNNKIIAEHGCGVKKVTSSEPITPETLFMIGSTTKPLTTFMMATLIDKGLFSWDTKVTDIMPHFSLADAAITEQLLMKHLVSASTGIPRQDADFFFNYSKVTPENRLDEMKAMKPTTGFGETFQYSNAMVSAGGFIAAYATRNNQNVSLGSLYDSAMQALFDSIGMKSTTFDFERVKQNNYAHPHSLSLHNTYKAFAVDQERWVESVRPAGGAWSTASDLARYMITELSNGVNAEGKRIISEETLLQRRESQIKITDTLSYGLGLMIDTNYDITVIGHDGSTTGFTSLMFFIPECKTGLVVLTNARGSMAFAQAVKRKFLELLYDAQPQAEQMLKLGTSQQKQITDKNVESVIMKPAIELLMPYIGTYYHPILGQIELRAEQDYVIFDAGVWQNKLGLKKESDGSVKLVFRDVPLAGLELKPNAQKIVLELGQHTYAFNKIS